MPYVEPEGTELNPFIKDPASILEYAVDWGKKWMKTGDHIVTSSWTVPVGMVMQGAAFTRSIAEVRVSGGTVGTTYELINDITTYRGRTDRRRVYVRVEYR